MGKLSKDDIESLMASQQESLAEPNTMAAIHNLLRINKLDDQQKEILRSLKKDSHETHALKEVVEDLVETIEGLLPLNHDKHHEHIASELLDNKIKEKQWRTIKTSAMAGIVILLVSFIGSSLATYVKSLLATTG